MSLSKKGIPGLAGPDSGVDPRSRSRVVPMEVLALGFSRTGTKSMQAALEILGLGPVYHGGNVVFDVQALEMVAEGVTAKLRPQEAKCVPFGRREFDQLLGECRAVTDAPICHFGPELMAAYPDAKVVLVEREVEAWCRSYGATVAQIPFRRSLLDRLIALLNQDVRRRRAASDAMFSAVFRAESRADVLANMPAVYREHYAEVRAAARPSQLLEYKLGSGWEPLCRFLGRPVPNVPFPRLNDGAEFERKIKAYRVHVLLYTLKQLTLGAGTLLAVVVGVWWAAKRWHLSRIW